MAVRPKGEELIQQKMIGLRMRKRMNSLLCDREEFARQLGISSDTLEGYLYGSYTPPLLKFFKICRMLRLDPEYVVYGYTLNKKEGDAE